MRSSGNFVKHFGKLTIVLALLLVLPASAALAQGNAITYGLPVIGTLNVQSPVLFYTFQGNAGDQIVAYAVGISPGISPSIGMLSPTQQQLTVNALDPFGSQAGGAARISYRLPATGAYTVTVSSPNGAQGDFLLRLDGLPSSASTNLALNAPTAVNILPNSLPIAYSFEGNPTAPQTLALSTTTPNFGFTAQVYDGNGQLIAVLAGQALQSANLSFTGQGLYQVVVTGLTPEMQGSVNISLAAGGTAIVSGGTTGTGTGATTATGSTGCTISNPAGGNVNIRSGPGTVYPAVGSLNVGASIDATGRDSSGTWYVVNVGGRQGWLAASVITAAGTCSTLPVVTAPPTPSVAATPVPTLVPTTVAGQPTAVPPTNVPPTNVPPTNVPPTNVPPTNPPPSQTFNISGAPTFGSTNLAGGFLPDPFTASITSGGPVDATFLGGPCRGFGAVNPDFQLFWTGNGSAQMTINFDSGGNGDTTLIINDANGGWWCDDDSGGNLNPSIRFAPPADGRYDIWVGSFSANDFISGTLNITEF